MTPERFSQIDSLLGLALERDPAERAGFLDKECRGDEELRQKLECLLASHAQAGEFLEDPHSELASLVLELKSEAKEALGKDGGESAGTLIGRYVVIGKLGRGGMGVVYAAHDPELDRKVAIKLMEPQPWDSTSPSDGHARLLREAQAMARLSHPNVIAVHDFGTFHDRVFISMEYVEGATLAAWLSKEKRPWREVVSAFVQAGRGLMAAHAAGILHRDFKPENVLIGADGRARVLDFGLARATSRADLTEPATRNQTRSEGQPSRPIPALEAVVTQPGKFMGTPAYMAPEQLLGNLGDARTDQYSFCSALYQLFMECCPSAEIPWKRFWRPSDKAD